MRCHRGTELVGLRIDCAWMRSPLPSREDRGEQVHEGGRRPGLLVVGHRHRRPLRCHPGSRWSEALRLNTASSSSPVSCVEQTPAPHGTGVCLIL